MEQLTEQLGLVGVTDPSSHGTGTSFTDVIDMSLHETAKFTMKIGDPGVAGVVNFRVQESIDGATGWRDIAGKAITPLVVADADSQVIVEVSEDEMDVNALYRYLRGVTEVTVNAVLLDAAALVDGTAYKPASDFQLASVVETIGAP